MIFEGDSANVINRVTYPRDDVKLLGYKIQDCVRIFKNNENYVFKWYTRSCNTVANCLSRYALENMYDLFFNMDIS